MRNQRVTIIAITVAITVITTGCLSHIYSNQSIRSGTTTPNPNESYSPSTTLQSPIPTIQKQTPIAKTPIETMPIPTINPCIVPAKGGGTYLHIISDSQQQLSGIQILVTPTAPSCPITSGAGPFTEKTNSSGWAYLGALPSNYNFNVSLEYEGRAYNISIPQWPLDITYATLRLPSGNTTIMLCSTTTQICRPYSPY